MRELSIREKGSQQMVCPKVMVAESFVERIIGLMFRKELSLDSGMLIVPCYQIHTFFMRMAIDVAFIDRNFKVLKIYRNLVPWRMTRIVWRSWSVLEMKAGSMPVQLKEGDQLEDICIS